MAHTVYDELIISEMSVVMKIGHLQEAAQFTVIEFFTFLVTPNSSRLNTLLLRECELRADPTKLHAYKDYSCFISHVLIMFLVRQECRMSEEVQTTFMKPTCTCTHSTHTPV